MNKKSILFIDDDAYLLDGLKRRLRNKHQAWNLFFAQGGKEGLELMKQQKFDMVISDMVMPDINGSELLNQVAELYPETVRIILSGNTKQELALASAAITHQFMNKPVDVDVLLYSIERVFRLRDLLGNQNLIQITTTVKNLPSIPRLAAMLIEEMNSPEPSIKKVAAIMSSDLAMTAKVMQLVNSAFFGLPQKVKNVQQATALLGIETLKALTIYVHAFDSHKFVDNQFFNVSSLQDHSLMVGKMAHDLILDITRDEKMAEDAMLAGFLHDIGYMLLIGIPDIHRDLLAVIKNQPSTLMEAEYHLFNVTHAEIGGYLLGMWGFSDNVVEAVAYHHRPSKSSVMNLSPLTAVHIANALLPMQWNPGYNNTKPLLDYNYIEALAFLPKLAKWEEYASESLKRGSNNEY